METIYSMMVSKECETLEDAYKNVHQGNGQFETLNISFYSQQINLNSNSKVFQFNFGTGIEHPFGEIQFRTVESRYFHDFHAELQKIVQLNSKIEFFGNENAKVKNIQDAILDRLIAFSQLISEHEKLELQKRERIRAFGMEMYELKALSLDQTHSILNAFK